ncbi:MAG: CpsD/CapB family tyrosine-protein kinase [Tissierellia bacterium]|nr:CpsD/CapB family tyrosine-protein kinase [Tissierellia bacterium]
MDKRKKYNKSLSLYNESIQSVRTNIELGNLNDKNKIIAITSSKPSEGKTTVLYDLAKSFAKNGHKVIILDCNLRMPNLKEICNIDSNIGITDIILKNAEINKAIIKDNEDNLYILPSGSILENPTQMLSSDNFKDLISKMSDDFDYVFIDTPPVGIFTDAAIISTLCDGVILTVKSKDTTKDEVSLAVNNLKKVNANILGAILTFSDVVYETYKKCLK